MMNDRGLMLMPALFAVLACGDFSLEPDRVPERIELLPDTLILTEGQTGRLALRVIDQDGQPFGVIPAWAAPAWETSPPGLLSLVGGEAEGLAPGAVTIGVSLAGLSGSSTVLVNPSELHLDIAAAYLTQATQRRDGSVPLVAGRDALLRVFLQGDAPNFFRPSVRATLYQANGFARTLRLEREALGVPLEVQRGSLLSSWNAVITGDLLEPGSQLVIEADPDGVVPVAPGSTVRVPVDGRLALDVVRMPDFRLRYVRVHLARHGTTGALAPADPVAFSRLIHEQFPLARMDVDVRGGAFASDARLDTRDGWSQLLYEIALLQYYDASDRYYYGVVERPAGTSIAGLGYIGYPAAIGADDLPDVAAHEIGHNFGLPHAPCGGAANADPDYPYPGASIGTFGYSIGRGELFDPGNTKDLMSYCGPAWISDYNYIRAMLFRDLYDWGWAGAMRGGATHTGATRTAKTSAAEVRTTSGDVREVLVLWGGAGDGRLLLEPAFRVDGPVALPRSEGPYRIDGYDESGTRLFGLSFAGRSVDHTPGGRHFLFGVPLAPAEFDRLRRIRLRGPEGTVERIALHSTRPRPTLSVQRARAGDRITWSFTDYPAALIRDAATGTLIGIDRDGRFEKPASSSAVEVLLSDGVRTVRTGAH